MLKKSVLLKGTASEPVLSYVLLKGTTSKPVLSYVLLKGTTSKPVLSYVLLKGTASAVPQARYLQCGFSRRGTLFPP